MDAIALMLMLLVVGLLITPAIHHRVVDDGDATARTQVLVGSVMTAALIPFALSSPSRFSSWLADSRPRRCRSCRGWHSRRGPVVLGSAQNCSR
jgi:hypothetical protein